MCEKTENDIKVSSAFYAAAKIRLSKKNDYGSIADYFPFGSRSYVHEIHKKTKRLVNLVETGADPNYESIEDNLLDLINYASYYYEFLKEELDE
jgi:hypothetical protein